LLPSELPPNNKRQTSLKHHSETPPPTKHTSKPQNHRKNKKNKTKTPNNNNNNKNSTYRFVFSVDSQVTSSLFFLSFSHFCLIKLLFVVQLSTQTSNPVM
jgi:hypothetical protein